ncbi:MAG: RsbRD N-terminal domain-containing protein [Deltaproteobacteria bacterium]|nr:RsbRD N-terminal domain-containing protein [Deltaproteobacteria bacterium]
MKNNTVQMKLESLLAEKQHAIEGRWFDLIVETYPLEGRQFLDNKKDRFDNPVAYEFRQGIEGIVEALVHGMKPDMLSEHLDKIISIKAIQELSPSKAVAFIFLLKTAIRGELQQEITAKGIPEELRELESRIDGLALLCFDIYMKRREKLFEIRTNEAKTRVSGLLRMAGLLSDLENEV